MNKCPHCGKLTITALAAWWSGSDSPAICKACQGVSYVRTSESNGILVVTQILVACVGLGAFVAQSWWGLSIGLCVPLAFYVLNWTRATLVPTTPEDVKAARRAGWVVIMVCGAVLCGAYALRKVLGHGA